MSLVKDLVTNLIKQNKIVIFSKSFCPYCAQAKDEFKKLSLQFNALELDQQKNGGEIQEYLSKQTGQRTVPNIFVNGQHLGGCDDLLKATKSGRLNQLLKSKI